jgi:glutamate synthase domain-containing protein 2
MDVGELRVVLGGPDCRQPYDASLLNISAMSFGALGANAIQALARGAAKGLFALDTGEGGISKYHLSEDNDLIYEIGSGYFGCRNSDGTFSSQLFAQQAVRPNVKAVLVKNSQGSKPSRGGILPAEKVSAEIAIARGVPMGQDCISPPKHSAFTGPDGLMRFVLELRNLSLGKPIGFKLCIGKPVEAAALVKAMLHTGITPDFIVIDGSEGGTGAAPVEFADNVGMPLREGLLLMNNLLRGAGLRDQIKLIASGKVISGFDIIRLLALGADMANSARGFMFALGCIAGQSCHKNTCPTGIATQDPLRQRALNVGIKSEQVYNFHRNTLASVAEILSAAGLQSARQVTPELIMRRIADNEIRSYAQLYTFLHHRELIEGRSASEFYREIWARARHDTYESA